MHGEGLSIAHWRAPRCALLCFVAASSARHATRTSCRVLGKPEELRNLRELGRAFFAPVGSLIFEGKKDCSLEAYTQNGTAEDKFALRHARIVCGGKGIDLLSVTMTDGTDSMQISEEIGTTTP